MSLPYWIGIKKLRKFREGTRYVVICDSCGETFLDVSVAEIIKLMQSGRWNRSQKWHIKAGYHWVETDLQHEINVRLILEDQTRIPVFQLSQQWRSALQYEPDQSKQAMLNELKHLESLTEDERAH